jgi:hypothetical protein
MTNAVAYSGAALITSVKSFIVLSHSRNFFFCCLGCSICRSHRLIIFWWKRKFPAKILNYSDKSKTKNSRGLGPYSQSFIFFLNLRMKTIS